MTIIRYVDPRSSGGGGTTTNLSASNAAQAAMLCMG